VLEGHGGAGEQVAGGGDEKGDVAPWHGLQALRVRLAFLPVAFAVFAVFAVFVVFAVLGGSRRGRGVSFLWPAEQREHEPLQARRHHVVAHPAKREEQDVGLHPKPLDNGKTNASRFGGVVVNRCGVVRTGCVVW